MNTYEPQTTLDAISRNAIAVVVIGGLSIVAIGFSTEGSSTPGKYVGTRAAACDHR